MHSILRGKRDFLGTYSWLKSEDEKPRDSTVLHRNQKSSELFDLLNISCK